MYYARYKYLQITKYFGLATNYIAAYFVHYQWMLQLNALQFFLTGNTIEDIVFDWICRYVVIYFA